MVQDEQRETHVSRVFEQPPDAMVCYADIAQVIGTGNEIMLQFYESVPGPPSGSRGEIQSVRSRLRATVIVSLSHAANLARILTEKVQQKETPKP